jgi:hypothetical protein
VISTDPCTFGLKTKKIIEKNKQIIFEEKKHSRERAPMIFVPFAFACTVQYKRSIIGKKLTDTF